MLITFAGLPDTNSICGILTFEHNAPTRFCVYSKLSDSETVVFPLRAAIIHRRLMLQKFGATTSLPELLSYSTLGRKRDSSPSQPPTSFLQPNNRQQSGRIDFELLLGTIALCASLPHAKYTYGRTVQLVSASWLCYQSRNSYRRIVHNRTTLFLKTL